MIFKFGYPVILNYTTFTFYGNYSSLSPRNLENCFLLKLNMVSDIPQHYILERFIHICDNANNIVVTKGGKRKRRTPLYIVGVKGSTLEFEMICFNIKSCLSKEAKGAIKIIKQKGWNSVCAELTGGSGDPLTWGISLDELRARSLASTKKVSFSLVEERAAG